MGMHASPTGEVFLQDCHVPSDRLLEGSGRSGGREVFLVKVLLEDGRVKVVRIEGAAGPDPR